MNRSGFIFILACFLTSAQAQNQPAKGNDVTAPLHALQPDYPVPYGPPTAAAVKQVSDRVLNYLASVTPTELVNRTTGATVDHSYKPDTSTMLKAGDFRIVSYEWGVTYMGMLQMGEATG